MMSFAILRRIVEARLYEYGAMAADHADAPISSAYEGIPPRPKHSHVGTTQPEQWVLSREWAVKIGRIVANMPETERKFVRLRYIQNLTWRAIEQELHLSQGAVAQVRDRVIAIVGTALGLIGAEKPDEAAV